MLILGKKRVEGRQLEDLKVGEVRKVKREIKDKDILLYLGITDDANPVYIQHNYTERTSYKKPIVPHILLVGMITSYISMELPGPGSVICEQRLSFPNVLYHYSEVEMTIEIKGVDTENRLVTLAVSCVDQDERPVVTGEVVLCPPEPLKPILENAFENF
ncbi:enoyl-CoA hydratase [Microaerobacter geothermalis]|uniref:MaoC/PaaZ C-terminal domain-containing protein n=1 Tax=Microaerobacter geothermalis TaxID=674972 RepID=UPI001F245123|nr:MaoC/PaaZ C-terminal domain-containing protein [Microaerobacter geothermalis]MCF6092954.1 enoyl-CoA hydratase [Microaerobacter geothermalis]